MGYAGKKSKIPKLWEKFQTKRNPFLDRAKKYAMLTLPYLMADKDNNISAQNGWQGVGAQATNHLANKLAQVLFPPQRSFFRVDLTEQGEQQLAAAGVKLTAMAQLFASIEKRAMAYGESLLFRPAVVEAFKHLIVAGNVMLYKPNKGSIQSVPLHHYVVRRDTNGDILDIIFLQEKALNTFEPAIRMAIEAAQGAKKSKENDDIKLYTHAEYQKDGMFIVRQSAGEVPVGKEYRVKPEKLPFLVLTWKRSYGEDYGRPLAEDHSGDLFVIQFLSEAIARGAALMSDIKYLVRPGAQTDVDHFVNSGTGEVIVGVEEDIHIVQLGKYADLTPIQAVLQEYVRRIGVVFMMEAMIRRDAERVTAYEIQRDALEVEQNLGGAYSLFSANMQRPLSLWFLQGIQSRLTSENIEPVIVTGIEALGRMAELDKFANFAQYMTMPATWPDGAQAALKWPDYIDWVRGQLSAELPFFKSEGELQADAEAAQAAASEQTMDEGVAKAIPNVVNNAMEE